ncbi:hypothetical protein AAH994_14985 [Weeksellaceae bacterium A-14]
MKENPEKYRELFKVFAILLTDGIIESKFVNNWADEILAKETESEYEFIEISTTLNLNDLITLLNKLSENCNLKISQRAIFGILYNSNIGEYIDIKNATKVVSKFTLNNSLTEKERAFLYGIDDFVDLAIEKIYGDLNKLKNEFWDFMEIYQELNFNSVENWNSINKKIEENLQIELEKVTDKYALKKKKWWQF